MDGERERAWLERLRQVCGRVAQETRRRALPAVILDAALELTRGERGFLVRVRPGPGRLKLKVECARGFDKSRILSAAGEVSRTVVTRVLERGRGVVTTSEGDVDLLDVTSIKDRKVRAILSFPLRVRGEALGVLYIDHRFDADVFKEEDLSVAASFADQAALVLETADLLADRAARDARVQATMAELEALRTRRDAVRALGGRYAVGELPRFGRLVGGSPASLALYEAVERAARSHAPLLICGEPGVGKREVAREVHARSERAGEPCVTWSCGELPGRLNAVLDEVGGGTLVLSDLGRLSGEHQAELLQLVQRELRPRLILTSSVDLGARVESGAFQARLFFRLDVMRLEVLALRERVEDIPALLTHFMSLAGPGLAQLEIDRAAFEALLHYRWPGNARELHNEVRRLMTLDRARVTRDDLSPEVRSGQVPPRDTSLAGKTLPEVERRMLGAALARAQGNKAEAARQLGIPRSTFLDLLQRHGLWDE